MTVLVVDDDEQMLGLVERWLADAGYNVVTCSRFTDARNHLSTHKVDALITDLRLGAYNGLQLALRLVQAGSTTPVLVTSGYDDIVSRRDAMACGASCFLLKPFDREFLLRHLSEALAARGQHRDCADGGRHGVAAQPRRAAGGAAHR
jgi:DNA-binding NtrC family response regulator